VRPLLTTLALVLSLTAGCSQTLTAPAPPPDSVRVDPPKLQPGATQMDALVEYRLANKGWVYTVTATNRDPSQDLCVMEGSFDKDLAYTPFSIVGPKGKARETYPLASIISAGPPLRLKPGQSVTQTWDLAATHDLRGIGSPVTVTFSAPFNPCEADE